MLRPSGEKQTNSSDVSYEKVTLSTPAAARTCENKPFVVWGEYAASHKFDVQFRLGNNHPRPRFPRAHLSLVIKLLSASGFDLFWGIPLAIYDGCSTLATTHVIESDAHD